MKPTLFFLTGASATGKTDLSLEWSLKNDGEILSCDSLLFYHGMDIGTAKPPPTQLDRVKHHGIDICPVTRAFNVVDYMEMSRLAIDDIHKRGKKVLIVGGSGFYLKSFFSPVVDESKIPDDILQEVNSLYENQGLVGLVEELKKLNPDGCGSLDLHNPRRVANSLRRCLATGKTVVQLSRQFSQLPPPYPNYKKQVCCLWRDKEDTRERVRRRVREMLRNDLLDEVRHLLGEGLEGNFSAASAIGYRECIEFLKSGSGDHNDLEEKIVKNTMRLVKKQRTWFKKQIPVERWLHLDKGEKGDSESLFG